MHTGSFSSNPYIVLRHSCGPRSCKYGCPISLGDAAWVVCSGSIGRASHGGLERSEYANIEGLGDMGCVRGKYHEVNRVIHAESKESRLDMTAVTVHNEETTCDRGG